MAKKFDLTKFLSSELQKMARPQRLEVFFGESYIGGSTSKLIFLNLSVPQVRAILKSSHPFFSETINTQFSAFEETWFNSNIFEVKSVSLYWLESLPIKILVKFSARIALWAPKIDNWAHSDSLCGVYAKIFEKNPKSLLATYTKWSGHKNPWLRRCSMVGVLYYSRCRKKFPTIKYLISAVRPHLLANEYYVQKAVGWTLREIYNVYPKETTQFIKVNLLKIQPAAWYATSEKLPLKLKVELVLARRKGRTDFSNVASVG